MIEKEKVGEAIEDNLRDTEKLTLVKGQKLVALMNSYDHSYEAGQDVQKYCATLI